ncbi:39S ribosomal protein L51, mitochondrial [Clydaea vesicula]|uniref:Large ribosomal subunit protein mL43 n=1 Tax=Clydaea vesicula TaxID=447962 RepID=A0AAD5U4P1_9FUNG|nr:39S ribosomal protein L51, mitochondrial [Clydaea vesicula]
MQLHNASENLNYLNLKQRPNLQQQRLQNINPLLQQLQLQNSPVFAKPPQKQHFNPVNNLSPQVITPVSDSSCSPVYPNHLVSPAPSLSSPPMLNTLNASGMNNNTLQTQLNSEFQSLALDICLTSKKHLKLESIKENLSILSYLSPVVKQGLLSAEVSAKKTDKEKVTNKNTQIKNEKSSTSSKKDKVSNNNSSSATKKKNNRPIKKVGKKSANNSADFGDGSGKKWWLHCGTPKEAWQNMGPYQLLNVLKKQSSLKNQLTKKPFLSSVAQNGVGAFVPYINRITFHYEQPKLNAGGTSIDVNSKTFSQGLVNFIRTTLPIVARENPHVEFLVQPTPKRYPQIKALYNNGVEKQLFVKRLSSSKINSLVKEFIQSSGKKPKKYYKPVISDGESITPIWNPFNSKLMFKP